MSKDQHRELVPVFVLGQQRSGTTWLANMLAAHSGIAGVQAKEHHGIHESVFFSHFARYYGALDDPDHFRRFCREFTASDYFLISGLDPEWFCAQRPSTYAKAFRVMMDAYGAGVGATHWVEKSPHHTLLAHELELAYPDAWFIGIVRTPAFQIISQLRHQDGGLPPLGTRLSIYARRAGAWSLYARYLKRFCAHHPRALLLSYEALKADPEAQMRKVLDRIGLAFEPGVLTLPFRPNTRFRDANEREAAIGRIERATCNAMSYGMGMVPFSLLAAFERSVRRRRGVEWPPWVWKRRPESAARPGGAA